MRCLQSRKGQSAIEYLTTYGWMILAVAIVSGVAYSNIEGSCTRTSSDFYTDALAINDFGLDGQENFIISLENDRYTEIRLNNINVTIDEENRFKSIGENISSGSTIQLSVSGFDSIQACNTMDVRLNFDRGPLKNQEVTGFIRAPIGIQ
jgi:hypothetical protein